MKPRLPAADGRKQMGVLARFVAAGVYRLFAFWSRIPVRWLAFSWMRRSGHI
ncbi:hypothetical protein G7043_40960 [Lentzea sp. NEAU-D13]|uniref:Uncharacterized protein n=1 Tax=Lentzea alba TaxID=2714351 RepID=A0A7C9RWZ1_9PSEU|nr:hypothetical protein [Lentzea alba]NGY65285.1 hypothetical protein [Lentzea alba]